MPNLTELSPYVRGILQDNHLEPLELLRYGPRFICMVVHNGERDGLFKMVLPLNERDPDKTPPGYVWTDFENIALLERRLLKEAFFLQFFSQQLGEAGFEPQIIALSETSPVWSLRTYIAERPMSAWDSTFVLSPRFFKSVSPRLAVDFFRRLHELSDELPYHLREYAKPFVSTLTSEHRFTGTVKRARVMPGFKPLADHLTERFATARPRYADYQKTVTQYEPYGCHIFILNGQFSLIDWENVGWGHSLQDLSVLWMRCFERPDWQDEYIRLLEGYGYFEGNGRLYWESELLIQSFANHAYFADGGPIGTPDYDKRALRFFEDTIKGILKTSDYFKV